MDEQVSLPVFCSAGSSNATTERPHHTRIERQAVVSLARAVRVLQVLKGSTVLERRGHFCNRWARCWLTECQPATAGARDRAVTADSTSRRAVRPFAIRGVARRRSGVRPARTI